MDGSKVRTAPVWVKILVLWHVFCITVWACPRPSDKLLDGSIKPGPLAIGDWIRIFDQNDLKSLNVVQDYIFTTGVWQYWDMFSPNPAYIDWYADAIVTYKDGTTRVSQYPRMALLSIPKKYVEERYRKFFERAHDEGNYPYFFVPFCYKQAADNYTDPKNPPVQVALRRNWHTVVIPGEKEDVGYHSYVYFVGAIDPRLLQKYKDGTP